MAAAAPPSPLGAPSRLLILLLLLAGHFSIARAGAAAAYHRVSRVLDPQSAAWSQSRPGPAGSGPSTAVSGCLQLTSQAETTDCLQRIDSAWVPPTRCDRDADCDPIKSELDMAASPTTVANNLDPALLDPAFLAGRVHTACRRVTTDLADPKACVGFAAQKWNSTSAAPRGDGMRPADERQCGDAVVFATDSTALRFIGREWWPRDGTGNCIGECDRWFDGCKVCLTFECSQQPYCAQPTARAQCADSGAIVVPVLARCVEEDGDPYGDTAPHVRSEHLDDPGHRRQLTLAEAEQHAQAEAAPEHNRNFPYCCAGMKTCLRKDAGWEYRCQKCEQECPDDVHYEARQCSVVPRTDDSGGGGPGGGGSGGGGDGGGDARGGRGGEQMHGHSSRGDNRSLSLWPLMALSALVVLGVTQYNQARSKRARLTANDLRGPVSFGGAGASASITVADMPGTKRPKHQQFTTATMAGHAGGGGCGGGTDDPSFLSTVGTKLDIDLGGDIWLPPSDAATADGGTSKREAVEGKHLGSGSYNPSEEHLAAFDEWTMPRLVSDFSSVPSEEGSSSDGGDDEASTSGSSGDFADFVGDIFDDAAWASEDGEGSSPSSDNGGSPKEAWDSLDVDISIDSSDESSSSSSSSDGGSPYRTDDGRQDPAAVEAAAFSVMMMGGGGAEMLPGFHSGTGYPFAEPGNSMGFPAAPHSFSSSSSSSSSSAAAVSSRNGAAAACGMGLQLAIIVDENAGADGSSPLYRCPFEQCRYSSPKRRYVADHMRTHKKLGPDAKRYPCPHPGCDYSATRARYIGEHMRRHTGVKQHKCTHPGCTYAAAAR
eukprot:SAG22_NODE_931_length_6450_cov_2.817981_7_plen_827_part_00